MEQSEKEKTALEFLEAVEDDSSWADDCTHSQIFTDDVDVLVEIEKEI